LGSSRGNQNAFGKPGEEKDRATTKRIHAFKAMEGGTVVGLKKNPPGPKTRPWERGGRIPVPTTIPS